MANNIFDPKSGNGGTVNTAVSTELMGNLIAGIGKSRESAPVGAGGKPLMRLMKSGMWVFGQDDADVQEGSIWAVNPLAIGHGFAAWSNNAAGTGKNSLLGEIMVPVTEPRPPMPDALPNAEWKLQRSAEMICTNGADKGVEVLYKTNSVSGLRAFDVFLGSLQAQLRVDPEHPVAMLRLGSSSYKHTQYGQIFTPVLEITGWATMHGEPADDGAPPAKAGGSGKPPLRSVDTDVPPEPPVGAPRRQRPAGRAV